MIRFSGSLQFHIVSGMLGSSARIRALCFNRVRDMLVASPMHVRTGIVTLNFYFYHSLDMVVDDF